MSKFKPNHRIRHGKELGRRQDPHVTFTQMWPDSPRLGRYWKRLLSKIRRRFIREEIRADLERDEPHDRGLPGIERVVNWKTW